ncbi:MAG: M23 family metallopeptidase [Bacilli bacterium]|nr:M23 family metallopeptidase [Bacilli bacterium]
MKQRNMKKYAVYVLSIALLGGTLLGTYLVNNKLENDDTKYVSDPILESVVPVVSTSDILIRPYTDSNVIILNNYYDYRSDEDTQINSIIFYNNTYMQNTGVIYGNDSEFDVVAIADGEVIKVEDSELSGKVVEIRHSNDVISVYQFLSDVNVSINTSVKQGDKIGKSGISNLVDNNKNQLYFELIIRGELVNGENYFGKNINEL